MERMRMVEKMRMISKVELYSTLLFLEGITSRFNR